MYRRNLSHPPITVRSVEEELPRVTPALLRRADDMCRRRIAKEHAGGKRFANRASDARFAVANRVVADARLAHAELGPPRTEAFVDPTDLEPEQRALYRAAVAGYLATFGAEPGRAADLGWRTVIEEQGVELLSDAGLAVELPDGRRELRQLRLSGNPVTLEPTDVFVALIRTRDWAPDDLRIVAVDLLSLESAEHIPDLGRERAEAFAWITERIELVKARALDGRAQAGADCSGCAFIAGCDRHT